MFEIIRTCGSDRDGGISFLVLIKIRYFLRNKDIKKILERVNIRGKG